MLKLLLWAVALWLLCTVVRRVFAARPAVRGEAEAAARTSGGAAAPERRRWALALADILSLRNGLPCNSDTLTTDLPAERRAQLARQLRRELDLPSELPDASVPAHVRSALAGWVGGLGRSNEGFYEQLAALGRVRDALAFDCARTAFLVRCIALLGWVPDSQAWIVLFLNAQRAQDSFDSWEDFGLAYARAREHWLQTSGQDGPASTRAAMEVREHLQNPQGSWRALPWKRYRIFDPQPLDHRPLRSPSPP